MVARLSASKSVPLGCLLTLFSLVGAGCGFDGGGAASADTGGDWTLDGEQMGPDGGPDATRLPDAPGPDDVRADATVPDPDTRPVSPDAGVDTDPGDPDTGLDPDVPDTDPPVDVGPDPDGGMPDGGLTDKAVSSAPWYAVLRVTETPAITGNVQEITFRPDKTVTIGFRGAVTGKWEIFDDDSVRLYALKDKDGNPNRPRQYVLEAELNRQNRLEAFELFIGRGPDGMPYKARYEQIDQSSINYSAIQGQWQSKTVYKNHQGTRYRIGVRVEQGGKISYGVVTLGYTEYSRGNGHVISYDTGQTFWFIEVSATGRKMAPLGGEIRRDASGSPVLYAPRAINKDGKPGAEDFEAIQLEPVSQFSL